MNWIVKGTQTQTEIGGFYVVGPEDHPPAAYVAQRDHAHLIAAAQELLEALKMLYAEDADYITRNNLGAMDNHCMRMARAAIAKAEGK